MSHHGQHPEDLEPLIKELQEHQERLEEKFPDGKLTESDEGALAFSVSTKGDKVVVIFAEPTTWLGMTGDQAAALGAILIQRGKEVGLTKPLTITL
jgi:hypothetical protein